MSITELPDFVLVLDRLRSAYNTGNIFRIAEALRAGVVTCGYTPAPPHPKLAKTAMGSDLTVPSVHYDQALTAVTALQEAGYTVLAAEPGGVEAWDYPCRFPLAIVLGNEALGVETEVLEKCTGIISLPMFGVKSSINVGNAAAAIGYAVIHTAGKFRQQE